MKTVEKIIKKYDPQSIFIYGSRARGDNFPESNWEIGVLSDQKNSSIKGVFFFSYSDFKKGLIDSPFPTEIYLRELSMSAKTLYGKKVVENFKPPSITALSLLERINFDCAISLGVIKEKNKEYFYKSSLFGIRNLIILKKKIFPLTYEDIFKASFDLNLGKFNYLPKKAYQTRIKKDEPTISDYKNNITFNNYIIRKRIKKFYEENGSKVIIK
jgi:predicted nucleotidyltransferase